MGYAFLLLTKIVKIQNLKRNMDSKPCEVFLKEEREERSKRSTFSMVEHQ